jgi:hypothetical protein
MSWSNVAVSYVADDAFAITKSDTVFANGLEARGLYVGGAGDVSVQTKAGTILTFTGVTAGQVLPIRVVAVRAATTATAIVGFKP